MPLRLRKIIPLLKAFKLNTAKTGISISAGKQGSIFNFGQNGIRTTIGKPGTGASYQEHITYSDLLRGRLKWPFIIVAVLVIAVLIWG
jgi:hypothetical protein